ncbi:uncharacterized protein PG998_003211 [Apiospora kogelbergensis]|uniref:Uncharacterized protein n=1 Tax=Apiospora kogelbergensis TaxID=1337665 RepID=A0AAW0QLN9_9PEZI
MTLKNIQVIPLKSRHALAKPPSLHLLSLVQQLPRTRPGALVDRLFGGSFALFYVSGCVLVICRMAYLHLHGLTPPPALDVLDGSGSLWEAWFVTAVNEKLPFHYLVGQCFVIFAVAFGARAFAGDPSCAWSSHLEVYSIFAFVSLHHEQGRLATMTPHKRKKTLQAAKIVTTLLLMGMLYMAFSMVPQHLSNVGEDWKWARDPNLPKWLILSSLYLILFDLLMIVWACALLPVLAFAVLASFLLCFAQSRDINVRVCGKDDEDVRWAYKEGGSGTEGVTDSGHVRPRSLKQKVAGLGESMLSFLARQM